MNEERRAKLRRQLHHGVITEEEFRHQMPCAAPEHSEVGPHNCLAEDCIPYEEDGPDAC